MKKVLLLLGIALVTGGRAFASDDENRIKVRTNFFFAVYASLGGVYAEQPGKEFLAGDPSQQWALTGPYVTAAFRGAYEKILKEAEENEGLDADPILDAQDIPKGPFETVNVVVKGDRASAQVKAKDWPDHPIRVTLVKEPAKEKEWRIDSINTVNERKNP